MQTRKDKPVTNEKKLNEVFGRLNRIRQWKLDPRHVETLGSNEPFDDGRLRRFIETLVSNEDAASKVTAIQRIFSSFLSPIDVTINKITPGVVWINGEVEITFIITNQGNSPSSGFVTADITDGPTSIARSRREKRDEISIPAGASVESSILIEPPFTPAIYGSSIEPGFYGVELRYWIVDDNGSITFINLDPITHEQHPITLGVAGEDWSEIELYPSCSADGGPDFIRIDSFVLDPPFLVADDSNQMATPGSHVTLKWEVQSGGFPAEGAHPGSISRVRLVGGFSTDPGSTMDVPPVGEIQINASGIPAAYLVQPWTLIAEGNCGVDQQTKSFQFRQAPPSIVNFSVNPDYINLGSSTQLNWKINSSDPYTVDIRGYDGVGNLVFTASKLPKQGSLTVTPSWDTKYTLTVRNSVGSVESSQWVKLYSQQTGCTIFYIKLTNAQSSVLPCFAVAICAQSEQEAIQLAKIDGYTAQVIDGAIFSRACD